MKKLLIILLVLMSLTSFSFLEEEKTPREQLIDDIISTAEKLYKNANGKAKKAAGKGDIYICKNFTVHIFRENAKNYALDGMEDVRLRIPNNLSPKKSKPNSYGIFWEEIPKEKGNAFELVDSFVYDKKLSKKENQEKALEFMKQVKKGDYFQMSANYYYGIGAHSLVFIEDYNPEKNTVKWTDSNMKGEKRNGVRYGYVQFNAEKDISWFVDAFCHKTRGASIYRLREDIVKK
mgnify:CR=1 FL=1